MNKFGLWDENGVNLVDMQNRLKPLTQVELELVVDEISEVLSGAQLQDILTNDRGMALVFRGAGSFSLLIDLAPNAPQLLLFEKETPFRKHPKAKPVGLFLNSHAKNLYFKGIEVLQDFGRVVNLYLGNTQSVCELEIRLIPKQANLIVTAAGKQISWEKPMELSPPPHVEQIPEPRSLDELRQAWKETLQAPQAGSMDPKVLWQKQRDKNLAKKRKALPEIQAQVDDPSFSEWISVGEHLKTFGFEGLRIEQRQYVDTEQTVSWNIEQCFKKAKQIQAKKEGAQRRLEILQEEIADLEKAQYSPKALQDKPVDMMKKADAKGRKMNLSSGAIAYCGKSARDNLALLRQAKAWDYWLHLRDYPGAHAIVHRKREQIISEKEFEQIAQWVAKESLAGKSLSDGQRLDVVIVEARFVRPIKGDKLGRVTYHSEKTLTFTVRQL